MSVAFIHTLKNATIGTASVTGTNMGKTLMDTIPNPKPIVPCTKPAVTMAAATMKTDSSSTAPVYAPKLATSRDAFQQLPEPAVAVAVRTS